MHRRLCGVAVLAAFTLAACTTTPPPPPPEPVLTLDGKTCAEAVAFGAPVSLTPDKADTKVHVVVKQFDAQTPCVVDAGGGRANYQVFELTPFTTGKLVTAGAPLGGKRILAVKVSVLDRNGGVSRAFTREDYLYRGDTYSVQFVPRPDEAFILIETDRALVGKVRESIATGVSTGSAGGYSPAVGSYSYTTIHGYDMQRAHTFSFEGDATVKVQVMNTQ